MDIRPAAMLVGEHDASVPLFDTTALHAVKAAEADENVGCLVITGAGETGAGGKSEAGL